MTLIEKLSNWVMVKDFQIESNGDLKVKPNHSGNNWVIEVIIHGKYPYKSEGFDGKWIWFKPLG